MDVVIDVRTKLEYWLGHLNGATCIPVHKLADTIAARKDIAKDARILLYCASGARSASAAGVLKSMGYKRVTDGGAMSAAKADYEA